MAKCFRCKKEMCDESTTTCEGNIMIRFPDGAEMEPIPFSPPDPTIRCHDCNVAAGGFHQQQGFSEQGCHSKPYIHRPFIQRDHCVLLIFIQM